MERNSLTVNDWQDHPTTRQIRDDVMLTVAPGIYYHFRLNMYVMIMSEMKLSHGVRHVIG